MTDPTKKDESEKAKAVKDAMTGTPDPSAKTTPAHKPAEPAKKAPEPDVTANAKTKSPPAAASKPPESVKEPAKPVAATQADAASSASAKEPPKETPKEPSKEPAKGSVPASSPSAGKLGAGAGGKEPPKGPAGPQAPGGGPGAPKGPGTPPSSPAAKSPPPQKPAATPKKKRGCLGSLVWLVVIVVALGVGAYYSWPYWPDVVKKPVEAKIDEVVPTVQTPEQREVLENQMAAFKQQVSELESKVAELADRKVMTEDQVKALVASGGGTDGAGANVSALTKRLEALEQTMSSMATAQAGGEGDGKTAAVAAVAGTAAIGASVQELSQRVQRLESEVATIEGVENRVTDIEKRTLGKPSGEAKAAVVLAVSHLSQAVMRSVPYESELDAVKAVAKDDSELAQPIATLEKQAGSGVPSLIELRASFPEVAREVSRIHAEWTGEGWVDKALSRMTSLVSVRKTGSDAVAAEGTDGILAQAEAALILGDVTEAVKALKGLDGPQAQAAAPWLAEAQKRLDALEALAALRQGAISLLATGS